MLDLEFEVNRLIRVVNDKNRSSCCGRKGLIRRFTRTLTALKQARNSGDYKKEELDIIEALINELADEVSINLSGLKRR